MARGSEVVVSSQPNGKWLEGTISGTPKPGTIVEIDPNTTFIGGQPVFRASTANDGVRRPIMVLDRDGLQGKLSTDAYVDGTRCRVYMPEAGDQLNLLLGDVTGTGDVVLQGDKFGVSSSGKLIADHGTFNTAPFQSMEAASGMTADSLLWVMHTGGYA